MAQGQILAGGSPTQSENLVSTDQVTILGDGTKASPLKTAAGAGAIELKLVPASSTFGSLFLAGSPLLGGTTAGTAAAAVAGQLTPPLGLAKVGGNTGNGADLVTFGPLTLTTAQWDAVVEGESGGLVPGATYYVAAGNLARLTTAPVGPAVGQAISQTTMFVQIGDVPPTLNLVNNGCTVAMVAQIDEPSSTVVATPCRASSLNASQACGIIIQLDNGQAVMQTSGLVTLTTAQWDAVVTGQSGGLTLTDTYYLSSSSSGFLTTTPPVGTGTFNVRVGVARSPTQLQLILGAPIGPHA